MRKYSNLLWMISLVFLLMSCDKRIDATMEKSEFVLPELDEDRGAAPGADYSVKAGEKYLNLVYFVPSDAEPESDWHWRLSGIMNHTQDFFGANLSKYYGKDINFKIARNVANPYYANIVLVKGTKSSKEYTMYHVQNEVMEYFRTHPEVKYSHHTLVLTPMAAGIPSGVMYGYDAVNIPNEFMGIVACDHGKFNIGYFRYAGARAAVLQKLGAVLKHTGLALGLTYNVQAADEIYTSLTTGDESIYIYTPDKLRLTNGDMEFIVHSELFNEQVDYNDIADVSVTSVNMSVANDNLKVVCEFTSSIKPVSFMVYNDFFLALDDETGNASDEAELMNKDMSTVQDAILTGTREITALGADRYRATVEIASASIPSEYRRALPGQDFAKAELRFRIIHENGTCTPSLMYAKCGTYYEDTQIYPDRFRYFYTLEPEGYFIPYRKEADLAGSPKNTWKIAAYEPESASTNVYKLIDGFIDTYNPWNPRFSIVEKPWVKVVRKDGSYWSSVKGFKIHPGLEKDRAKAITIKATVWDGAAWVEKVIVENYPLKGMGKYYYYIDAPATYLYDFTVMVEQTCGTITTSMAEIGLY